MHAFRAASAIALAAAPRWAFAQGIESALGAAFTALMLSVAAGLLGIGLIIRHVVVRSRGSRMALGIFGGFVLLGGLAAGFTDGQEMRSIAGTCFLAACVTLLIAGLVKERGQH